jgi:molybdopterin/thiamine biosynthesis adenylyltransferase
MSATTNKARSTTSAQTAKVAKVGKVGVIGVGGLGCPASLALCEGLSAGGARPATLVLVDDETVDLSNLHRQVLYGAADVSRAKVEVARERLSAWFAGVAPKVTIEARRERLQGARLVEFVSEMDVVVDGTDAAETKLLVNDACVRAGVPLVHAGVVGLEGQVLAVIPGVTPCVRCLFGEVDGAAAGAAGPAAVAPDSEAPTCAADGVLGPVAGVVGAAAGEMAHSLFGGAIPAQPLVRYDGRTGRLRSVPIRRRASCPACAGVNASASTTASTFGE